jgi:hypothetical protein
MILYFIEGLTPNNNGNESPEDSPVCKMLRSQDPDP